MVRAAGSARRHAAAAAAVALVSVVAACGGGGSDDAADSTLPPFTNPPRLTTSTAGPPTTAPPRLDSYTVRPGDVLGVIARNHGVTVEDIVAANGITDPDRIAVGDILIIPAPGFASTTTTVGTVTTAGG